MQKRSIPKWLGMLLAVLLTAALVLTGCGGASPEAGKMLVLWEATLPEDDSHHLYLLGSIHFGREETYPLPATYEGALADADALAVEIDLLAYEQDPELQLEIASKYGYYSDGSTVKDHLSKETYAAAKQALEDAGVYQPYYDTLKVSQWSSLLTSLAIERAGYDTKYGIDRHSGQLFLFLERDT